MTPRPANEVRVNGSAAGSICGKASIGVITGWLVCHGS